MTAAIQRTTVGRTLAALAALAILVGDWHAATAHGAHTSERILAWSYTSARTIARTRHDHDRASGTQDAPSGSLL